MSALLLAFFSAPGTAVADTGTIPATRSYSINAIYYLCGGTINERLSFTTLEAAGQFLAPKVVSATNCTLGLEWHYDYLSAIDVGDGVWQLMGRSHYNGNINVLANAVLQYSCPSGTTDDGNGQCRWVCPADQVRNPVTQICEGKCPVGELTDLPTKEQDPDTYAFEYENKRVDTTRLSPRMQEALICLVEKSGTPDTNFVTSAWRPPAYQAHLREIWEKWRELQKPRNKIPACDARISEIYRELRSHEMEELGTPPAGPNGPHPRGEAIDVKTYFIPQVDAFANVCQVYRPLPVKDKWHVIHR